MYIYKTTNLINDKIYIGQTSKSLDIAYFGSGKLLIKALIKHGETNFKREILETCSEKDSLNEKEVYWINFYNSTDRKIGYNISNGGTGGNLGDEVNKLISTNRKNKGLGNQHRKGKPSWNKGLTKDDPRVLKYSSQLQGKSKTEEHKKKLSETKKKSGKKIICLNNNKIYNSLKLAAEDLKIWAPGITEVLKKRKPHAKGYIFEYVENKISKF